MNSTTEPLPLPNLDSSAVNYLAGYLEGRIQSGSITVQAWNEAIADAAAFQGRNRARAAATVQEILGEAAHRVGKGTRPAAGA